MNNAHWLVILEEGEDYEIEHPPDCPAETYWIDPEGHPIRGFTCLVGILIHEAGLEEQGIGWRSFPVGRYRLDAWSQHYASTPWRSEEWDAGLTVEVPE